MVMYKARIRYHDGDHAGYLYCFDEGTPADAKAKMISVVGYRYWIDTPHLICVDNDAVFSKLPVF